MCISDHQKQLWLEALSNRGVWCRVCKLELSVGLLQAVINQGITGRATPRDLVGGHQDG